MTAPTTVARPTPRMVLLLGPAFVACIAYVDPGNVAANMAAGARYGALLIWVLVLACAMAMLIQYQSAKLGLVTGQSLPGLLGARLKPWQRRIYWLQAEIIAMATDLAEVIGGALALQLLFGLPLPIGAVIVGVVATVILRVQDVGGQKAFERVIIAFLVIIVWGFLSALLVQPPSPAQIAAGLIPRFADTDSVLLAASMVGATVMPHAIYLHSALAKDRHGQLAGTELRAVVRATRWDIVVALGIAAIVNIGMLVLAATSLFGRDGADTIPGAHALMVSTFGVGIGILFALGLLASGLSSTAVGCYAGAAIMDGLLRRRIPMVLRRVVTLVPAVVLLWVGMEPTLALVLSQVVLSLGIPFALIPLIALTGNKKLMGDYVDSWLTKLLVRGACVAIVVLNVVLIGLTVSEAFIG